MTKPRIRWIAGQGWTVLHLNLGFDDLPTAIAVATGRAWSTPRRSTDMVDAFAYAFAGRRGSGNVPFFTGVDHARGPDQHVEAKIRGVDGTVVIDELSTYRPERREDVELYGIPTDFKRQIDARRSR